MAAPRWCVVVISMGKGQMGNVGLTVSFSECYDGCPYQKPHPPSESLYPCHAEYTPAPIPVNEDKR